jgi:8-oxo-dGTP diphosphatase
VDVVAVTPRDGALAVLLQREGGRESSRESSRDGSREGSRDRWTLPWAAPRANEPLDEVAQQVAREAIGTSPSWISQVGAFADGQHPSDTDLSVGYVALVPLGADSTDPDHEWRPVGDLAGVGERQEAIIQSALAAVRDRLDLYPIAFRLLPTAFTLSELQQMYELLLGRRLHKASFRRALQAAYLVEPTDEWRSEGRGRPAQLYRYAPKRRRRARRGVRFDLLG